MHSFIDAQFRQEVEMGIQDVPHDQKGEEGLLYRRNYPGSGAIWVKRWYRSHDNNVVLPEEVKGSATSPYFHAVRMLELDLSHQAFPEHVVETGGAYDTRIGSDSLRIAPGYSTTITKEPAHDPELLARRNEIVVESYRVLFKRKALVRAELGGTYDITNDPVISSNRSRTDQKIHELLGRELDFPLMDTGRDLKRNVDRMRDINPSNVMIKMVQAGVYPIHPQLNFIPRKPTTYAKPPHGTFIEMRMYDPVLLEAHMKKKIGEDTPEFREFSQKLSLFKVYEKLDKVFNRLVLFSNFGEQDYLKLSDENVLTAIFRVLEALGELYERGIVNLENTEIINRIEYVIANGFNLYNDRESIARHILQIETSLKKLLTRR